MQLDLMRRANEPIVRVKNSIEWSDARKAGKRVLPPAMLRAYVTESSSSIANGDPFWTIANSGNEDRDGEKIADTAWRLDDFMKNPVMPWSHMWYCSPVGKWLQAVPDAGGLKAQGQFAVEADDFAAAVARHFAFGSLRSFSVGFDPRAWTEADGKTYTRNAGDMFPGTRPGRTYTEVVLLEISPVVLPSDAGAIMQRFEGLELEDGGTLLEAIGKSFSEPAPKKSETETDPNDELSELDRYLKDLGFPVTPKAGRVISAANLEKLAAARDAIEAVIQAAQPEETD